MTPETVGFSARPAVVAAIAPWNSADVASAPGVSDRKSAIMLLLPDPKSSSRRAATSADSELESSQPPELRAPAVWAARTDEAMAMTTASRATGRRKR